MFGNVPLNNRLASINPQAESSAAIWQNNLHRWTRWNHLRTAAALASSVLVAASSAYK
jgi:uncharacterized membrane protein